MIPLDEAQKLLLSGITLLGAERVALADAFRRVLAEELRAGRDQPPVSVSAMDGYAVRTADARIGAVLQVIGEAPAGAPFDGAVEAGQAVRIATGGALPRGAGRIVIQEHVRRARDSIRIEDVSTASFVRPAGGDFRAGDAIALAGQFVTPARLGLIAANGRGDVLVARRPRVAIVPSGDELREPGQPPSAAGVYNSAAYAVAALVEQWGGTAVRTAILPDESAAIDAGLASILHEVDVVVPLGGASVGDRDLLRPAFEAHGARIVFNRVAVIPGKPTWHARCFGGPLVLGLPGNPASAFVCAHLFLRPLLQTLTGASPTSRLHSARLTAGLAPNGPREAYLRAEALIQDGAVEIAVAAHQDSSLQVPLAAANALVRRMPNAPAAARGDLVEYLPLAAAH